MGTFRLPRRQVHLDFHTSPFIPEVGAEFDAEAFADTFARAKVESVTVFAKCHHGMCYYPTKVGRAHPGLVRKDLLGEQIEALHRRGIRAPIYTTLAWEEDVADRFPQWRQMTADGRFARVGSSADGKTKQPAGWKFNDWMNPEYQDYFAAHLQELLDHYPVDGVFFDIVFYARDGIYSEACKRFRAERGIGENEFVKFETAAQVEFARRFSSQVRAKHPNATLFYNTHNNVQIDPKLGPVARWADQTHWEIESLPSGSWGYHHFPRLGRMAVGKGVQWLGMTGRFQRMWGDFGGLKPQPALEYECFRSQALGGGNSVGDQLHPRGMTDRGAYKLIGRVFEQCERAEEFYRGSEAIPQVGILIPGDPSVDSDKVDLALEGAVMLMEELHYDAVVLDESGSLEGLELVVLPDSVVVSEGLKAKLKAFVKGGGKVVSSYRAGVDLLGLKVQGEVEKWPTYWRAEEGFDGALSESDRVVYQRGLNVTLPSGGKVLVKRVLPYFKRTDLTYCSHFQTPPSPVADQYAAVMEGEGWVYFADPVFAEYRQSGNTAVGIAVGEAMRRLVGPAPYGDELAKTILCYPRRRGSDLILTLLHYVPTRKCLDIDVIDERMSFAGEVLYLPDSEAVPRVFGSGEELKREGMTRGWVLPAARGRLLIEVPGFFA